MTEDVRKLLGAYATGTLTDDERTLLYQAALRDESLFEALADEHALRELLDDPASRASVLHALENRPFSITGVLRDWFERPKSKALVAAGGILVVAIVVTQVLPQLKPGRIEVARTEVSRSGEPVTSTAVPPPAAQSSAPSPVTDQPVQHA